MEKIIIDDFNEEELINKDFLNHFYDWVSYEASFLFKSNFINSKKIREIVFIISEIIWIPSLWQKRFIIIIDELVNNSIEYWSSADSFNKLVFYSKKEKDIINIQLEIKDNWDWNASKTAEEMEEIRIKKLNEWFNMNSIRWRWLFLIITKLVNKLYFKNRQNWWLTVWIEKTIDLNDYKN